MTIIVSNINFSNTIREALNSHVNGFEIDGELQRIYFYLKDKKSKPISSHVTPKLGDENYSITGDFNTVKWYEVMRFLQKLEEQPVSIEFEQYPSEDFQITLSQFIKRF